VFEFLSLIIGTIRSVVRGRKDLVLENLLLRQRLQVALRRTRTLRTGTRASHSRLFLFLNPFMRFMLRVPIRRMRHRLMLISFTGRKSGRYFIPRPCLRMATSSSPISSTMRAPGGIQARITGVQ
jgi:hypothetical protein